MTFANIEKITMRFIDLNAQQRLIINKIDLRNQKVIAHCNYILSPEANKLGKNLQTLLALNILSHLKLDRCIADSSNSF